VPPPEEALGPISSSLLLPASGGLAAKAVQELSEAGYQSLGLMPKAERAFGKN